ncbi:MAG: ABC transporter permease subunit [Anaerolineaceae bacterium]|nr:ABC transporter permease subunit [Anaerolineaceae bacterium]MBN2677252.1 ABC transporter permease subunit [Anaerolineaceae bacterium]
MNIYLHEFKTRLSSVLIWSGSIAALIFVFLSMFQAFAADAAMVDDLMKAFPEELLIAFGMTDMDWSTILGFFGLLFTFAQICLAIQSANYGVGLVSVEETEWTADFLLSKPVSRTRIMTSKLLAAITSLAITQAVIWVCSFAFISIFRQGQTYQVKPVVLLLLSMIIFQLFFLTVGMLISLLVKRVRNVLPISMGLVFGLYILNAFGSMIGEKSLEILSPFQHFSPSYIIKHAAWDWSLVMISVAAIIISVVGSYVLYSRRNIPSAV